jgi:hypothetical protein
MLDDGVEGLNVASVAGLVHGAGIDGHAAEESLGESPALVGLLGRGRGAELADHLTEFLDGVHAVMVSELGTQKKKGSVKSPSVEVG